MVSFSEALFALVALIIPSKSDSLAMSPLRMPAMRVIDTLGSTLDSSLARLPLSVWIARNAPETVTFGVDWGQVPHAMDPRSTTWRSHRPDQSGGELTPRGRRKRTQIENFVAILKILLAGCHDADDRRLTIVDFGT